MQGQADTNWRPGRQRVARLHAAPLHLPRQCALQQSRRHGSIGLSRSLRRPASGAAAGACPAPTRSGSGATRAARLQYSDTAAAGRHAPSRTSCSARVGSAPASTGCRSRRPRRSGRSRAPLGAAAPSPSSTEDEGPEPGTRRARKRPTGRESRPRNAARRASRQLQSRPVASCARSTDGIRIARANDKGEREILDDKQPRRRELKRARSGSHRRAGLQVALRRAPRGGRDSAAAAPPSGRPAAAGTPRTRSAVAQHGHRGSRSLPQHHRPPAPRRVDLRMRARAGRSRAARRARSRPRASAQRRPIVDGARRAGCTPTDDSTRRAPRQRAP